MLKGYWQIPLTDRAKEISAFTTPDGLYRYRMMPFGMKNAGATFQRLMNELTSELEGCEAYIDDLVVYSDSWKEHVTRLKALFARLKMANLTVNLVKSEFGKATVQFLGHEIGLGKVRPVNAKVEAIVNFPAPTTKKELQRFLGTIGYYRKYCKNLSDIISPLTDLLKGNAKFLWSESQKHSFEQAKMILMCAPVLQAPNFDKTFTLAVDASDLGAGAELQQEGDDGALHPVCYFSRKFNPCQRNYSTIEQEALSLILALQHFEIYLKDTKYPVTVLTDHNPLTFIDKMKGKNQRILRWCLQLQEYNLDIKHIRGINNIVPDTLSRGFDKE